MACLDVERDRLGSRTLPFGSPRRLNDRVSPPILDDERIERVPNYFASRRPRQMLAMLVAKCADGRAAAFGRGATIAVACRAAASDFDNAARLAAADADWGPKSSAIARRSYLLPVTCCTRRHSPAGRLRDGRSNRRTHIRSRLFARMFAELPFDDVRLNGYDLHIADSIRPTVAGP